MKPVLQPRSLAEGSAIDAFFYRSDLMTRTIKLGMPFRRIDMTFREHTFEGKTLSGWIGPVIPEFPARVTLLARPQERV